MHKDPLITILRSYIDDINALNGFDLAWEWFGNFDEPYIRVYEEAENHELCSGTPSKIFEAIKKSLPGWHLEDPGLLGVPQPEETVGL